MNSPSSIVSGAIVRELRRKVNYTLQEKFSPAGINTYKDGQEQAIVATMLGYDAFVRMPTGGGKTLCFQLPALHNHGVTVIFSPLIALIRDQSMKMWNGTPNIPCAVFDERKMAREASLGKFPYFKLLYVTPEKAVRNRQFARYLDYLHRRNLLARFVVDEAHCVNHWGNSFRPDFLILADFLKKFRDNSEKRVPLLALTASNSERDCSKVMNYLEMDRQLFFKSDLTRSNLNYEVITKSRMNLAQIVKHFLPRPGSGIVYCLTESECKMTAKLIGLAARPYYSNLSENRKKRYQDKWMSGEIRVLCATSAFGMGIDKRDVRFIIHRSMPRSLTEYFQETGRAGRDGASAECVLLYRFEDQFRIMREIEAMDCKAKYKKERMDALREIVAYCEAKISSDSTISPLQFQTELNTFDVSNSDGLQILSIVSKLGRIKLSNLCKVSEEKGSFLSSAEVDIPRLIHQLILAGHLRISLLFNCFMKCTPFVSMSYKGRQKLIQNSH